MAPMGLRARLLLFVVLAAVLPLGVFGAASIDVATDRLQSSLEDQQAAVAMSLALNLDTWLELQLRTLHQQALTFPVARLSPVAVSGFTQMVAGQVPEAHIVTLVDGRLISVVPAVMATGRGSASAGVGELLSQLPVGGAAEAGPRVGLPYAPMRGAGPAIAVLTPVPESALGLVVELSLAGAVRRLQAQAGDQGEVILLDAEGRAFAGDAAALPPAAALETLRGLSGVINVQAEGGAQIAALAPVPRTGWTVVVVRSAELVEGAVTDISLRLAWLGGVALACAVVVGVWFARQLTAPIDGLRQATQRVAGGALGAQAAPSGPRELVELARAFNEMSAQLQTDAARIEAQTQALRGNALRIQQQNDEIESFNRDLQLMVDQRTADLRAAQARLVEAARFAAVGELGAGLAHELNNPLAGLLGMAQVIRAQTPAESPIGPLLRSLEEQGRRCAEIVRALQQLSASPDPAEGAPLGPSEVSMDEVLDGVLPLLRPSFSQRRLRLSRGDRAAWRVKAPRAALEQALAQLLTALRAAAPPGGEVWVGVRADREGPRLEMLVEDAQGTALAAQGDDWMAQGMATWAARRALSALGGALQEPAVGEPARWTLRMPGG